MNAFDKEEAFKIVTDQMSMGKILKTEMKFLVAGFTLCSLLIHQKTSWAHQRYRRRYLMDIKPSI